ncbi:MAG: DNA gyrase inhibitor YacG [Phycisphaerales bacterium]|jgi:endogenous inhibitor of DNA gyrase (YacG/DUF329 family)
MKHRCPVCHKIVKESVQKQLKQVKFFPFCSQQCKLIDLGDWLDAKYKIVTVQHRYEPDETHEGSSKTLTEN